MKLTGLRQKVFLDRYSVKDKKGRAMEKTPPEMWRRIAKGISLKENEKRQKTWEKAFYNLLQNFKFVPAGRILSGAGTGYEVTYFNCFVIPSPHDSRGGIIKALDTLVEIQARAGGVGINLSSLRPRGERVRKVNGVSSGPVVWAGLFSYATHEVVQQGGSRRGATMLMMWDWHPDIEEFITVKKDLTKIQGANLSVCISDEFMEAVEGDRDWQLVFPDIADKEYDEKWNGDIREWKKLGKKIIVHKTIKARTLWDLIAEAAWQSAEPGIHFLDRSNKMSNTWYFEKLIATNPCGEQPLSAWGVCNLGAMNLASYVKKGLFDYKTFSKDVSIAIRFLDNVIDDTYYFYPENERLAKNIRRIGLGIMGLADALINMKLRYGAKESLPIIEKIFKTLRDSAYEASIQLSAEKGSFPLFNKEKYLQGNYIQQLPLAIQKKIQKHGIRNAVLLTIAPTGTTSILAGVSSGIEPVYEFEYLQRDRIGEHTIIHPLYEKWKNKHPHDTKPSYFVSANDLTPMEHVRVQAIAQKYIDASISKTVNAPNTHTKDDVKNLYMAAYKMGLKGIAYMRDGSRQGALERKDGAKETKEVHKPPEYTVKPRPLVVQGSTYKIQTPVGTAFITVNTNGNQEPLEIFVNVGKAGSDLSAMAEGLGRMISLGLRFSSHLPPRVRVAEIVDQLSHIGGARSYGFGKERVRSLPDAIAKALALHYQINGEKKHEKETNGQGDLHPSEKESVIKTTQESLIPEFVLLEQREGHFDICPSCGSASYVYEEGCKKCYNCGQSEC